jgi:hypothetical protein
MPTREQVTNYEAEAVLLADITEDGTVAGEIVDARKLGPGLSFLFLVSTNDGSTSKFTLKLEHGEDPALADAEDIPEEMLVYGRDTGGILPSVIGINTPGTAAAKLPTEGIFSTKSYIRASIITTLWDGTAAAKVQVIAIKNPTLRPTKQKAI